MTKLSDFELNEKQKNAYKKYKVPDKYSETGMKFVVINRAMATNSETYKDVNIPYIVVSIGGIDTPEWNVPVNEKCLGVLKVRFDDISYRPEDTFHGYDRPTQKITEKDAKEILDFVLKHKDSVKQIVVNCHAGLSRSTGVATALSMILNGKDKNPELFIESIAGLRYANLLIRDTILKEYEKILSS
jgi:predicted protein tyrosine phosphatase